jgi:hypothetical protein
MKTSALFAALVALTVLPVSAHAQQMQLQIENGRVTLDAQNVPVRQILAEWARVGGARIVNGEKVVGAPLTLQLQAVPERQALDIILRGVSGYMLAERQMGSVGASTFDRIMILPTSAAPRPAPAQASFGSGAPNRQMPAPPAQAEPVEEFVPDGDEEDNDDTAEDPPADVEEGAGEPSSMPNRFQRRGQIFQNPMGVQQRLMPQPGAVQVFPAQPGTVAQPAQPQPGVPVNTPFGVPAGASTTPGVVTPVPQQQTSPSTPTTRPPGVQ